MVYDASRWAVTATINIANEMTFLENLTWVAGGQILSVATKQGAVHHYLTQVRASGWFGEDKRGGIGTDVKR